MKKFIEELSIEELVKVFKANEKLRRMVQEDMEETEMHWIEEKLDYVKISLNEWSIDSYGNNYIHVDTSSYNKMCKFLEGLKSMSKEVPAFSEEKAEELISELENALEAYGEIPLDDSSYEKVEDKAIFVTKSVANALCNQFSSDLQYCQEYKNIEDYFIEFYADARLDEKGEYYIIEDDNDYKLYQNVSYTKTFS